MNPDQFRKALSDLNWSLFDAALKMGVTTRTVRRYLSGETPVPKSTAFGLKCMMKPVKAQSYAQAALKKGW